MITHIDNIIYNLLYKLMGLKIEIIMNFISYLGSATIVIVITILSLTLLENKKNAKSIALNLFLVFIINRILKSIIKRPRPDNVLKLTTVGGYSFPSGHAMVSIGFYGLIIYLIVKNEKNKNLKTIYVSALLILILLIGISRIYLGAHYATDVIGAYIIGTFYLYFYIKYIHIKIK